MSSPESNPTIALPEIPRPFIVPPSTFWVNLPHFLQSLGTAAIPLAAYIQLHVLTDPFWTDTFGSMANLPGIILGLGGIFTNIGSVFITKSNDKAFDKVLDAQTAHVDKVETAAAAVVEKALEAPAVVPTGKDPVRFRLRLALTESTEKENFEVSDAILAILRKMGGAA